MDIGNYDTFTILCRFLKDAVYNTYPQDGIGGVRQTFQFIEHIEILGKREIRFRFRDVSGLGGYFIEELRRGSVGTMPFCSQPEVFRHHRS